MTAEADDDHQIGYQALPRGVPVHASDGELLGTVHRVQDNAREHIFDGIVVSTEDGRRFVDAPEVARIFERAVMLTISSEAAKNLPERGSATVERIRDTTTARRMQRLGRSVRERWDQR